MSAKIRKHQHTLVHSGLALILFGLWGILRLSVMIIQNGSVIAEMIPKDPILTPKQALILVYSLVFVVAAGDLLVRLYVGIRAIQEGRGRSRRITYVVISVVVLALYAYSDITFFGTSLYKGLTTEAVATIIVDFTSCIAFWEIIFASLAIRRYRRMERREKGEAYAD